MRISDPHTSASVSWSWTDVFLGFVSGVSLCVGLYLAFYYAPLLKHNGLPWWSQKIFYVHVPVAWGAMVGLIFVLVGSIMFFRTRQPQWDHVTVAAAEPCLLYATLVMVTGPLWAKPSWNTFWKWDDPRLMSFFALWLILVAYQVLRSFSEEGEGKYLTSAALGILGSLSVPFVYFSVRMGHTLHPKPSRMEMAMEVRITTWVFLLSFSLLFVLIYRFRKRLEQQRHRLLKLTQRLADVG